MDFYYSARVDVFLLLQEEIPFDLFILRSPLKYTCVFRAGDIPDEARFLNYISKGIDRFYFKAQDQGEFLRIFTRKAEMFRSESTFRSEGGVELLDALAEQVFSNVYLNKICSPENIETFKELAQSYVSIVQNEPQILPDLIRLARLKPEHFKHGILAAIFSTLLARARYPGNSKLQMVCGLTGLLHDIGFARLSPEIEEFDAPMWTPESLEVRRHPQVGADLLLNADLPVGVRTGILQHHEAYDGSGYPMGLKGEAISFPARVVAIANAFVYLTTGSRTTAPMTVEQAMLTIHADDTLDTSLFQTLAKLLLVA